MKILTIIGEILRQFVSLSINIYVYRRFGPGYMLCFSLFFTLSITRKIFFTILSLMLQKIGLTVGYISVWHRSIEDLNFRLSLKSFLFNLRIDYIYLFPNYQIFPIPIQIEGIHIEIHEKDPHDIKSVQSKKNMTVSKSATSDIVAKKVNRAIIRTNLISAILKAILRCFSLKVINVSVVFYGLCDIVAFKLSLESFSFICQVNKKWRNLDYKVSLYKFSIYSRENVYSGNSNNKADLYIPSINFILGSSRNILRRFAEYVTLDFGEDFQFSFSSQLLRLIYVFQKKDLSSVVSGKYNDNLENDDNDNLENRDKIEDIIEEINSVENEKPKKLSISKKEDLIAPPPQFYETFSKIFGQIPDLSITFGNLTVNFVTPNITFPISFRGSLYTNLDYNCEYGSDDGKMKIEFQLNEFVVNQNITIQGFVFSYLFSFVSTKKFQENPPPLLMTFLQDFITNSICTTSLDYIHCIFTKRFGETVIHILEMIQQQAKRFDKKKKNIERRRSVAVTNQFTMNSTNNIKPSQYPNSNSNSLLPPPPIPPPPPPPLPVEVVQKNDLDIFGIMYSTKFIIQFSLGSLIIDIAKDLTSSVADCKLKVQNVSLSIPPVSYYGDEKGKERGIGIGSGDISLINSSSENDSDKEDNNKATTTTTTTTTTTPLTKDSENNLYFSSLNTLNVNCYTACEFVILDVLTASMLEGYEDKYIMGRLLYLPDIKLNVNYIHHKKSFKQIMNIADSMNIEFGFRTIYSYFNQAELDHLLNITSDVMYFINNLKALLPKKETQNQPPPPTENNSYRPYSTSVPSLQNLPPIPSSTTNGLIPPPTPPKPKKKKLTLSMTVNLQSLNLQLNGLYTSNDNMFISIESIECIVSHSSSLSVDIQTITVNSAIDISPPILYINTVHITKTDLLSISIQKPEVHINFGIIYTLIHYALSLVDMIKRILPKKQNNNTNTENDETKSNNKSNKPPRVTVLSFIPFNHFQLSIDTLQLFLNFDHSYFFFTNEYGVIQYNIIDNHHVFYLEMQNFSFFISGQEYPFFALPFGNIQYIIPVNYIPIHTTNLLLLPHVIITTRDLFFLYEHDSNFGEIIGDCLEQYKCFKTLMKAYTFKYAGDDLEEHNNMQRINKVDYSKSYILEMTCGHFEFILNDKETTVTNINNTNRLCSIVGDTLYLLAYWNPEEHGRVYLIDRITQLDSCSDENKPLYNGGYGDVYGITIETLTGFQFAVFLRDFPMPLVELTNVEISGFFSIGDIAVVPEAIVRCESALSSDIYYNKIPTPILRSLESTKLYFDFDLNSFTLDVSYGNCLAPTLAVLSDVFGRFTPNSLDTKSPKMPWWDKMRYMLHGKMNVNVHNNLIFCWYNANPYDDNYLKIILTNMSLEYSEPKVFLIEFDGVIAAINGLERESKIFLSATHVAITLTIGWTCYGGDSENHHVFLNLPESYDKFNNFRSLAIKWSIDIYSRKPDSISRIHSLELYLQWIDYVLWIKSFIMKIINTPGTSVSLGTLTTDVEIIFGSENPLLVWWLVNDSTEAFVPEGKTFQLRLLAHKKILTPDLTYPVFGCDSMYQIQSLCLEIDEMRIDKWNRLLKPKIKRHPFEVIRNNDTFICTIEKLILLMGKEETKYQDYIRYVKLEEKALADSNPPYVVVDQMKFLWTVPIKRFMFKVKDDIMSILFPPSNPITDNSILINSKFQTQQHLLGSMGNPNDLLSSSTYNNHSEDDEDYEPWMDVDESYFRMIGVKHKKLELPSSHISMVCILTQMQLNCMSMDSNYTSVVITADQVTMVRSSHLGEQQQEISKTSIHLDDVQLFIFPHDYTNKIVWVKDSDRGTPVQLVNHSVFDVTMIFNPKPPQSVNHMDPIIDSDEINKFTATCPSIDFSANALQFSETLDAVQNVILFSFTNNTTLPLPHKPGASRLGKQTIQHLLENIDSIMKEYRDERYVTYIMHVIINGGKWNMKNTTTGETFGIFAFNNLEMSRFTYNDVTQLTTINCSTFELSMKVKENTNFKKIVAPKIVDKVALKSPMLAIRTETATPVSVEQWPISIYFHIEINVFPCSENRIFITVTSNLFRLLHDYFFPVDNDKEIENEKPEQSSHNHTFVLKKDPSNVETPCCICNKIVNGMRNVEWQCSDCGNFAHTVCKDNTELEGNLAFINYLRIGDLKTVISVDTSKFSLDSWNAYLNQLSMSRNLSTFSGVFHSFKIHYSAEALRLAPTLVMKKLKKEDKSKKNKDGNSVFDIIRHRMRGLDGGNPM